MLKNQSSPAKGYIDFEINKHHRQIFREQIRPSLINRLDINENPSQIYKNAYQNVYKDELEKSMEDYTIKKMQKCITQRNQQNIITMRNNLNLSRNLQLLNKIKNPVNLTARTAPIQTQSKNQQFNGSMNSQNPLKQSMNSQDPLKQSMNSQDPLKQSMNSQNPLKQSQYYSQKKQPENYPALQNKKINFRDYFQQRNQRFDQHINYNFDAGNSFFKIQDDYRFKRRQQQQNTIDFIKKQLDFKQHLKQTQRDKQNTQAAISKEMQLYRENLERQNYKKEIQHKQLMLTMKMQQAEQEKIKRQRKSKQFKYNQFSNYNPIVNPIQYHIDNPYILRKIQDRNY